ncbi:MAG TPA: hypothetical protein DFS52_15755 [Myxococcales bacterium]|jgi:hypothetical protein|nr:hypothetical protein [Myxococcales bacterium]
MEGAYPIHYLFRMSEGTEVEFTVRLDPETLLNVAPLPEAAPEWTRLEFQKCPNCSLAPQQMPLCPTAAQLVEAAAGFSQTLSFEEAEVRVDVPERSMSARTTVQAGLSSLLGIYMSTSGCPILAKLRPMVRFHLPFATPLETMFRSTSMYLVGQFLRMQEGHAPDWTLAGLADTYRETAEVNRAFARRLWAASEKDANINALILLDVFTKAVSDSIEDRLVELKSIFSAWDGPAG